MKLNPKLHLYASLSHLGLVKRSYIAKIMLVAFLGTHIPLLALLCSFVFSNTYSFETAVRILTVALLATLAGTAATLYALRQLLSPVILTSNSLQDYLKTQALPALPTQFTDEAGLLMAGTTQTLHKLDELIHYLTHYDDLTGLPNRELFRDRLQTTLLQPQNSQRLVAVILLSIDDFAGMRHTLEHSATNLLLREIAQRLTTCLGTTDILANLNGDEFAIARTEVASFEGVIKLAQLLLNTLAKPFYIEGNPIHLTASIGITINDLETPNGVEQLLQQAHMALYQAKQLGRSQYHFYSPEINTHLQERLLLENELHGALERNEMVVYYQPLIDLKTRQVTAVEALVRWQHPVHGLISPAKFIPIAETNGLIVPLGEWVLRTACAQNQSWQKAGFDSIRMSVNLSGRQFEQTNLTEVVSQILAETGLEAAQLELEVTESFLMQDVTHSVATLQQLKQLGILLALDDFGTGYSSLNYLKRFPIDILKIDRSFIQDVTSNPDSAAVTDAIIALAKSLALGITAEGIETQSQLDYLQKRGCNEGQGFYFSRPIPADQVVSLLRGNVNRAVALSTLA